MVCVYVNVLQKILPRNILTGTGLTDGFPPGGVDAHDVRLYYLEALAKGRRQRTQQRSQNITTTVCPALSSHYEILTYLAYFVGTWWKTDGFGGCRGLAEECRSRITADKSRKSIVFIVL
jgi:hypothetical protein